MTVTDEIKMMWVLGGKPCLDCGKPSVGKIYEPLTNFYTIDLFCRACWGLRRDQNDELD